MPSQVPAVQVEVVVEEEPVLILLDDCTHYSDAVFNYVVNFALCLAIVETRPQL